MDLFVMNRYLAEDQTNEEEKLLEKLKSKISVKKVRKETPQTETPSKRSKTETSNDEAITVAPKIEEKPVTTTTTTEAIQKKAKKKRRKGKNKETLDGAIVKDGFQVLGEKLDQTNNRVQRVLPSWLSNPDFISIDLTDQQTSVQDMPGLDDHLRSHLKSNEISFFFPVQRLVIPWLIKSERFKFFRPNDICVSAPTGSGKTLSFVLPIVQSLMTRVVPRVRALIILPVQELATQVYKVFLSYCESSNLKVRLVSGQKSFTHEQSELVKMGNVGTFHSLADILVATPGRIVDHLQKTEGLDLTHLRYLVIDEADRVMEDVQNDWLTHVENAVYATGSGRSPPGSLNVHSANSRNNIPLQKLLFSATLSKDPEILQQLNLYEPKMFSTSVDPDNIVAKKMSIGKSEFTTPLELKERFVRCDDPQKKPLLLYTLLTNKSLKNVLIFTNSGDSSHKLAILLHQFGLSVDELSSKAQDKRAKVLSQFRSCNLDFLVCTDALARGIDIGTVDYVVSYDLPKFVTTYIHRVGRTARAGRQGTAITIIEKNEDKRFKSLLKECGKTSTVDEEIISTELFDEKAYADARQKAANILVEEKKKNVEQKKSAAFGKKKKNKITK